MIVVSNKWLPFEGFKAMAVWPFVFIREDVVVTDVDINHEKIHGRQQLEMLIVPFYVWYVVEYLVRSIGGSYNPYRNISFEREAYANEQNMDYLAKRRFWSFWKYLCYGDGNQ